MLWYIQRKTKYCIIRGRYFKKNNCYFVSPKTTLLFQLLDQKQPIYSVSCHLANI